jgi:hypothetical protein
MNRRLRLRVASPAVYTLLVSLVFFPLLLARSLSNGSPTKVACGQTITEDTTLDEDLTCPPDTDFAIAIGASNITLDLNGHVLSGYAPIGRIGGVGVFVQDKEGVIIRNGTIEEFNDGISIAGTRRLTIENLTVKNRRIIDPNHFVFGVAIYHSQDVVVRDMLFEFPSVAHKSAVEIWESNVAVSNIEVHGGGVGVSFSFNQICDPAHTPSNGTVLNSRFSGIYIAGIWAACSSSARIEGNDFSTAPGVGVGIQGDAPFFGAVTDITVEGNHIHDASTGIEFRGIIESSISNNIVSDNGAWGIAMRQSLGCLNPEPGWECFYSTANVITDNEALGNGTDLYHHEDSRGNIWKRNTCETKQGVDIPECTIPLVTIGRVNDDVALIWRHHSANTNGYEVWCSTTDPYFAPGASGAISVTVPLPGGYTHSGAMSSTDNYFYTVLGVNGVGEKSSPSNRTGKYSFDLTPGAP